MIKEFEMNDLDRCAELMMSVYNNELWQCHWSLEKAKAYLLDYVESKKFIGYTLWIDNVIKGAYSVMKKYGGTIMKFLSTRCS